MTKKAWLVMDGRYQSNPDDATVLEAYIEQPQPTWTQLSNDWGGIGAVLVEYDVESKKHTNTLFNPRMVGVIQ